MLHPQLGIQGFPKPMTGSNVIFLGMVWNRTFAPLWLNVRFINATRENQSKLRAHSNRFQFALLFGEIFQWISLLACLNRAISQSSWWLLIVFPNMFIYVLFNTHSLHPSWLKSSWIISSSFMEYLILLSLTEIPLSPAMFGKNSSSYRAPTCISAPPIILRQMAKLKL